MFSARKAAQHSDFRKCLLRCGWLGGRDHKYGNRDQHGFREPTLGS